MKDLINKIQELKGYENYDYDQAITDVEILLNTYNLITTPKQIKLSDVLSKLNEKDYRKFEITRNGTCISLDNTNCYRDYINIEDNKIVDISYDMQVSEFKWLYALWITETKIIDDTTEE